MPVLTVVKTPDGATPTAGDAVTFRIVTTNNGPGTALGATLFDDLPEVAGDWAVVANDPAATGMGRLHGDSEPANVEPNAEPRTSARCLSCGPESIGQGGTRTVTVGVTLQAGDCDNLPNLATADATNANPASDTGSMNPFCPQIRVEKTPDEIEGQAGANDVTAGDAATFTITVFNDGDGTANGVNLFDDLPGLGWSVVAGASTTLTNCAVSSALVNVDADPELEDVGQWLGCGPDTIGAGLSKKATVTKTTVNPTDCG